MSAQLAEHGVPTNRFTAHLALAAGVTVSIHAPTMHDLSSVVGKLQATEPANDAGNGAKVAGSPATKTAASSAQGAAGKAAGDAGNASASTGTQGNAQPAAGGSAQAGDTGNATGAAAGAQTASSSAASGSPEITFDVLKKAFLALSTKAGGREKCEAVLASVEPKPAKLSAATPDQYPALMTAIEEAAK